MLSYPQEFSKDEKKMLLGKNIPFSYLPDSVLEEIAASTGAACFPTGCYIFREGERSKKTLYLVLEGEARAVVNIGGEEAVTAVRGRGDFFGVTVLLSDDRYPVSMRASQDLTCLLISQESFQTALGSSERFADYFTQALAMRLKEIYQAFSGNHPGTYIPENQTLRQRVAEIASTSVITCSEDESIREVAQKMNSSNVSSVVVVDSTGKPKGLITEKDLVGKVIAAEVGYSLQAASEVMNSRFFSVRPGDFTYKALLEMFKQNVKHVLVTGEDGSLQGIVTVKDLIRTRITGALSIVQQIEYSREYSELAEVIKDVDQVQQALLTERSYASEICALISELYDRITRRIIDIAEANLARDGWGSPPARYCFINMGSAGRKEQFGRTDQDNGLIIEDRKGPSDLHVISYFSALGTSIVQGLETCGFRRCRGKVMADNPRWCKPLAGWKETVWGWVDQLDPEDIRNMTIFLDYRFLAGEASLYDELKSFTTNVFRDSSHALLFMAEDDLRQRAPLNIFRQIITERSGGKRNLLNLKSTAMVHMVDCIRLFALREGIQETNTFERIRRLREQAVFSPEDADFFEAASEALLMFRIRDAAEKSRKGRQVDNYIDIARLTKKDKALLKESLLVVNRLQSLTAHTFHAHKL